MASIEIPPNTSSQGIALLREMAELIGRIFSEGSVAPTKPATASVTRDGTEPTGKQLGTNGVLGVCPKCRVGSVVRKQRSNGGSYLSCSTRDHTDKSTCQFSVWDSDQIDDFMAGRPLKFKPFRKATAAKQESPSATASAIPNTDLQDVFALIDILNTMKQPERDKVLRPLGYEGGSYVLFLNNAKAEVVAQVAQALA